MHEVVHDGGLTTKFSREIMPGDVLKLSKGERIPADAIVLSTSLEEGVCYVDTMNLDGETSLKRRTAIAYTQKYQCPEVRTDLCKT